VIAVLHPYFKLQYIKHAWGGAEEQAAEWASGNQNAKNWQEEAMGVVEKAVSCVCISVTFNTKRYYNIR
jgi:hypothetical protein